MKKVECCVVGMQGNIEENVRQRSCEKSEILGKVRQLK